MKYKPPKTDLIWEGTEDQLALAFSNAHPDLKYIARWNKWYRWDGKRWAEDDTLEVYDLVRYYCRHHAFILERGKRLKAAQAATVAAIERFAKSDRRHAARVDQWDRDPWLLNTPDGIIDLKTGELKPHRQKAYMTKMTAVGPNGQCPRWRTYLGEITQDDKDQIAYMRRLCGYILTGSTQEHIFAFFYGTGANGKSTFVRTLAGVIGDYATFAPVETFTESYGERHPADLAMLRGARLVVAQETESGRRWAESKIKLLTGGDPISARFMRQDFFTFVPQFKLIVAGNHKPMLRNLDEAMRRRLHLVPFSMKLAPNKRDTDLENKLRPEWPGILKWAIDGCLEFQQSGLAPPESVRAATEDYFDAQDLFGQWLEERCEIGPDFWEPPTALFRSWQEFCDQFQQRPGTQATFAECLEAAGFTKGRAGSRGGRYWQGLRVKLSV